MTKENTPDINQEVAQAEADLQSALEAIKSTDESPKRETLRLPKKENVAESEREEVVPQAEEYYEEPQDQKQNFVETNDPAIQKRINELYKQSKEESEKNILLQDELKRLINATEARESEYQKRLFELENRHIQQDEQAALSQLRQEYKSAIENFDYDKASEINEKIIDFKTEQRLNSIQKQVQPKQQQQPVYGNLAIDEAELNVLIAQKDETGQALRPWLKENHPAFKDVCNATAIIADRYLKKGQRPSVAQVISEAERSLGLGKRSQETPQNKQPSHPAVLSSNTMAAGISENQGDKLSAEQRLFASKLGISEKDYARSLRLSKSGPISVKSL